MENTAWIPFDASSAVTELESVKTAVGGLDKTLQSLQTRLERIFTGITLAQYFEDVLSASGKLDKELLVMRLALGKLRVAVSDAFAPIGQVVLPVLNDAIFATIRFVKSAGKIVRALFGVTDSAADAADAENAYAQAISAASGTASRSLASFDRLNRLQKSTGSSTYSVSTPKTESSELNLQEYLIFNTLRNMLKPLEEIDLSPLTDALQALRAALKPITAELFAGLRWAWDNLFVPIIQWSTEILLPKVVETLSQALQTLNAVIEACKPALSYLWENFLQPLAQWAGQYLLEQLDQLQTKLYTVQTWASNFPFSAQQVLLWLNEFSGGIIPATELLALFNLTSDQSAGKVSKFGYGIWALTSPFSTLGELLGAVAGDVELFGGKWESMAGASSAAYEIIAGTWGGFGSWFRANVYDSLETGFRESGNGILSSVSGVSSGATAGMNSLIEGINRVKFTIPGWVPLLGGKDFGFQIPLLKAPQIPQLAKGAVLPANKPFLAVVGDQRHGTNVEAPLQTIQDAVRIELQDLMDSNLAGQEAITGVLRQILEAVLGIHISDDRIAVAADRYQSKMAVVHGGLY